VWFLVLATLGVTWIVEKPEVLLAINPMLAAGFFLDNGVTGFLVLASVLLVVTGAEAIYTDMGHFGRLPIRLGWMTVVLPCLVLNYFGQGALLLIRPEAVENPFFHMAPGWALYPLVALATAATVVASQAVISGAFSITRQALQLGFLPRMEIRHSSAYEIGQVYAPVVNGLLMLCTIGLVIGFGSSENLAGAYGVAVSMDMVATTSLALLLAVRRWGWSPWLVGAFGSVFLTVNLSFVAAATTKILYGGWLPLVVAAILFTVMMTWRRGADLLDQYAKAARLPVEYFLDDLDRHSLPRVPGTAIVMDARGVGVPRTLLHNIKHNKVLHERLILLTLRTADVPHVPPAERLRLQYHRPDFLRVIARYGFMETPSVAEVLQLLKDHDVDVDPMQATFFFGRETLVIGEKREMSAWRKYLYDFLFRNAYGAYLHLGVPPNRVIEIGQQVEI